MSSRFGFNTGYVEDLYAQFLENPESVSERWREFFADYDPGPTFHPPAPQVKVDVAQETDVRPAEPSGDGARADVPDRDAPQEARQRRTTPPPPEGAETRALKGPAARIVENMEASVEIPTATSARQVAVKLMAENRRLINQHQRTLGGDKVSYTHVIAYAIVQALRRYPVMNYSFRRQDGVMERVESGSINFGLAIDVERRGGRSLMVPNIKDAQKLSFPEFVGAYNDVVRRARDGRLELSDFEGTTVTLTNPGMIGTGMSVPRLMRGQGLILATGAIEYPPEYQALPPAEISRLGISQVMTVTSTYDHRIIQGAESGMLDRKSVV